MVRILHTADIHLDSPLKSLALRDATLRESVEAATRTAFQTIIDTALSEHAEALLIAGDLFDGKQRSARTAVFLTEQLERLRTAGIKVFYVKGNHDAENALSGAVELPDNVHVFSGRGGKVQLTEGIWIHGISFTERHAPDSLLPRFSTPVPGAINIALLHTSLNGAPGHDVYAPCTVKDLSSMGFDYWALGHIHKRQIHAEDPWVVMPGIPQGRDVGEVGPKSASLITITDNNIEISEVQTSALEFIKSNLDITATDSNDTMRDLLRRHLREISGKLESTAGVVRLNLHGAPMHQWQVLRDKDYWQEQTADLARETDCLWIDKLIFNLDTPTANENSANAIDELAIIINQIQNESGFGKTAQTLITEIVNELPAEVRARMLPTEENVQLLANKLSESGAQQILARMRGADS